MFTWK